MSPTLSPRATQAVQRGYNAARRAMHWLKRWRFRSRAVMIAVAIAAVVGLLAGSQAHKGMSWPDLTESEVGTTLPADFLYRAGEALGTLESADTLTNTRWKFEETAVALYEAAAYGPDVTATDARLRLAIIYGQRGYDKQASEMLATIPLQAVEMTRVAALLDWLYGAGTRPPELGDAMADMAKLDRWLLRRVRLRLAEKQQGAKAVEKLKSEDERAQLIFLVGLLGELAAWGLVLAIGATVAIWWFLRWFFTRRPTLPVRLAPLVRPWRPLDALEVWALLLFLVVVVRIMQGLVGMGLGPQPLVYAVFDTAGYLLAVGSALAFVLCKLARQSLGPLYLLGLKGSALSGVARGVVAYGILGAGILASVALANYLFGTPAYLGLAQTADSRLRFGLDHPGAAILYAVMAVMVAPVVEEALFRGFIYAGLRRQFNLFWSVVASAGMFAATHVGLNLVSLVGIFLLAVALAYTYERTRNLWVSVGMHITHNALVFALLALAAI